jgi:hypothetical protein
MTNSYEVLVNVLPGNGSDEQLDQFTSSLSRELRDLGVDPDYASADELPSEAKGLGFLVGWLVVHVTMDRVKSLVNIIRDWASRADRTVEIWYGEDKITVQKATNVQQEKLIGEWLERHAGSR